MTAATLLAVVGYLLPVAIWISLRLRGENDDAKTIAIELPVALSVDLLSVLLLSRLLRLETATLVSRLAWLGGGGFVWIRRYCAGWRPRFPTSGQRHALAVVGVVVVGAMLVSVRLSRPCAIWDREWHIPLSSSLRGQRTPFQNVYQLGTGLFYHFAGDVQAAMLQTLSGARLHSSLALSLSHDLMFGLIGLNLVCFLRVLQIRGLILPLLLFLAVVMIGPVTLLRSGETRLESGFALVNILTLSFRPHVPLACLLVLTFVETLFVSFLTADAPEPWRGRAAGLAALAALLVITDESSLGIVGLSMGALWLFEPRILAPTRRAGVLVVVAILVAMAGTVACLGGSLGPKAPHYLVHWVVPRAPGYAGPSLPLATAEGRAVLVQDLLPVLGVLVALALIAFRLRDRVSAGLTIFFGTAALASIVGLTCIDFENKASESHRFVTAMFVIAPLLATVALIHLSRSVPPVAAMGGTAALVVYACLGLGVVSTVQWLESEVALKQCTTFKGFYGWGSDRFFDVDCRKETDARLGQVAEQTYVDSGGFYLWAGCHSIFAPSAPVLAKDHKIKTGWPIYGSKAIDQMRVRAPAANAVLTVICLTAHAAGANLDPVCKRATEMHVCTPLVAPFNRCSLEGPARDALAKGL